MRKIINRKYTITPSLAGMAGWLFIITMLVGVFFDTAKEAGVQTQNLSDEVISGMVIVVPPQIDLEANIDSTKKQHSRVGTKRNRVSSRIMLRTDRLFDPILFQAANRHDVEPALVKAIIRAESGYNSKATSHKGARGLMQLMPATADSLGVEDYYHPEDNINGGVKYFRQLLNQYDGDVKLALAAYNAGSGRVRMYKGVPPYKATREYIKKVFEYYHFYKKQMPSA